MTEDFLYYVWQYKLFSKSDIYTTDKQLISIVKTGLHNKNTGPDFLNAHLKIASQLWVGNVEMHIKSSDWYLHNHENDVNYDAVILHVVWEHDATVFMKNNQPLPTIELQYFVDKNILLNYKSLLYQKQKWIPCEKQIAHTASFLIDNWLERLYFVRLEQKAIFIKDLLVKTKHDFEAVLFHLIAKNFGLNVNSDSFFQLANSVDFSVVRKLQFDEHQLTALFFGQAGFLEEDLEEPYHQQLKTTYTYLQHKYKLKPISKNQFQFFRMRPTNFPTIRIAQLVGLFFTHQNLFSKIINITKKEDFYALFSFKIDVFWQTHYTFEKESKKSPKKLTKSFIDLLLINTVIPLKFVFLQHQNIEDNQNIIQLMQQISSEKNSIISKFAALQIKAKNALESQALLQLKNNYCTKKRCLQCVIGNNLLRK